MLPALDLHLDEAAWDMIGARGDATQGLAGHPQALLRRLIGRIGVRREDVRTLGAPPASLAARAAFLSEALRPADSTDLWRQREAALAPAAVAAALDGVSIIVADNETEEALALAIAMREVLETPGKTAALVTPDPSIARRVSAELARWGVEVEDSAGRTLGQSEAGALARLVLKAAVDLRPLNVQALIVHPAARFGRARAECERAARALELGIFRAAPLAFARRSRQGLRRRAGRRRRPARPPGDPVDRRRAARRRRKSCARPRRRSGPAARALRFRPVARMARSCTARRSTPSWRRRKATARRRTGSRRWPR